MNRIPSMKALFEEPPKPSYKDIIAMTVDFIQRYNKWLKTLTVNQPVILRRHGGNEIFKEAGVVGKITKTRIFIVTFRENETLKTVAEFYKLRPLSSGLPKPDEVLICPMSSDNVFYLEEFFEKP